MLEVQGVATNKNDVFPYSGIRILGIMQVILGVVTFLLGVIDLALTLKSHDADAAKYGLDYDLIVTLTVASAPLWCGMWFAIAGSIGTCVSRHRAHSLHFLKLSFLVLNMLCACLFGPVCGALSGLIAYYRHSLDHTELQWLLTLAIAFLAALEVCLAAVSSSVACCCAPLKTTQVHVIVNPPASTRAQSGVSSSAGHNLGVNATANNYDVLANNNRYDAKSQHDKNSVIISNRSDQGDRRNLDTNDQSFENETEAQVERGQAYDGFGDSGGLPTLKKWALPGW